MAERPRRIDRVLLKLSGEALCRRGELGIDPEQLSWIAEQIKAVHELGVQIAIVLGGGNLMRGAGLARAGINRATADHMGMLATAINCLGLQDALEKLGLDTRAMSAVSMNSYMEPYVRRRADRHLVRERIVLLASGTGNPFCTTDTAATLRATELKADVLLKATKVDGVYTADPQKDPDATRIDQLSFREALEQELQIMDMTAFTMAQENDLPVMVFDLFQDGNLVRAVKGEAIGTWVLPG